MYTVIAWNTGEEKDTLLVTRDIEYAVYFAGEASYEYDNVVTRDEEYNFF